MAPAPGPRGAKGDPFHDDRLESIGRLHPRHAAQVAEQAREFLEAGAGGGVGGEQTVEIAGFLGGGLAVEYRVHELIDSILVHGLSGPAGP
ncbi:MAG: hypothetical protein IPP91_19460 [Betaproteobacteria bacterium]|nr:hypothetical protein [Betaproteobacteria bacterium]